MKISHHLDDATLVAYTAGTLNEALSVAVASHLAVCRQCREAARRAEAIGGAILDAVEAQPVSADSLAHMMARIDRAGAAPEIGTAPVRVVTDPRVPHPLARYLDGGLDAIRWRWIAPGVHSHRLAPSDGGGNLQLLKIGPGLAMPEHGHGGAELTLILEGSYSDSTGSYRPGDIADLDEDVEHSPVVDSDIPCICLVATEAPTRFKGLLGRILQPYFRI